MLRAADEVRTAQFDRFAGEIDADMVAVATIIPGRGRLVLYLGRMLGFSPKAELPDRFVDI
jgi:hypothetical protein